MASKRCGHRAGAEGSEDDASQAAVRDECGSRESNLDCCEIEAKPGEHVLAQVAFGCSVEPGRDATIAENAWGWRWMQFVELDEMSRRKRGKLGAGVVGVKKQGKFPQCQHLIRR